MLLYRTVAVDASPLIVLSKSDLAHILPLLFDQINIAPAVNDEILAGPADDIARLALPKMHWLERTGHVEVAHDLMSFGLGSGEAQTLSLVRSEADSVALIDDAAARSCARSLGISYIGTGGVLALAERRKIIPSLREAIAAVQNAGLWISQDVIDLLLTKIGK